MSSQIVRSLRELADFIEREGVTATKYAAAGDDTHIVLMVTVRSGGDAVRDLVNGGIRRVCKGNLPLADEPQIPLL